jgi:hypothetical protein
MGMVRWKSLMGSWEVHRASRPSRRPPLAGSGRNGRGGGARGVEIRVILAELRAWRGLERRSRCLRCQGSRPQGCRRRGDRGRRASVGGRGGQWINATKPGWLSQGSALVCPERVGIRRPGAAPDCITAHQPLPKAQQLGCGGSDLAGGDQSIELRSELKLEVCSVFMK